MKGSDTIATQEKVLQSKENKYYDHQKLRQGLGKWQNKPVWMLDTDALTVTYNTPMLSRA